MKKISFFISAFLTIGFLSYSLISVAVEVDKTLTPIEKPSMIKMDCSCTEPAHVTIICESNVWDPSTNFDYFESDSGTLNVHSSQNSYGAYCSGNAQAADHVGEIYRCPQDCYDQCISQITFFEMKIFRAQLLSCVNYFQSKCATSSTVEGSYSPNPFGVLGWWTAYGVCQADYLDGEVIFNGE